MVELIGVCAFAVGIVGYSMMQRQAMRVNLPLGVCCLFFPPLLFYAVPAYWKSMQHGAIFFLSGLFCGGLCWLAITAAA